MSSLVTSKLSSAPVWSMGSRRYLHRAPDLQYLKFWKENGIDFRDSLSERSNFYQSPRLVERTLQTMTASKLKGEFSFLHAMPAGGKVLMEVATMLSSTMDNKGRPFKYLRSPFGAHAQRSLKEARGDVPEESSGREQKPGLLSLSYALASSNQSLEGAAAWGFVNHFGNEQYFPLLHSWNSLLFQMGMSPEDRAYQYFSVKGGNLIRKYNRLLVGNLLVLSVPSAVVDEYIYDSKAYNVPTGKKVSEVGSHPEGHMDSLESKQTHMATLLLCRETLHPESGIAIVDVTVPEEVESFCSGAQFSSMKSVPALEGLVSPEATYFERAQEHLRQEADQSLKQLAQELQEAMLSKGEGDFPPVEVDFAVGDLPPSLP